MEISGTQGLGPHRNFLLNLAVHIRQAKVIAITGHINADPDAVAAAMALKTLLMHEFPEKQFIVILPQLNKIAKIAWNQFLSADATWKISRNWDDAIELLIVVDTNDLNMIDIPELKNETENGSGTDQLKIVIIDHHSFPSKFDPRVVLTHIYDDYCSTAGILTEFYQVLEQIPSLPIIKMLLTGILTDTGHFRYADARSLERVKYLLDLGNLTLQDITTYLQVPMARSEKIARIRAAMRIQKLHFIHDFIFAISHVSSYEASASKGLLDLGIDVSFVVAFDKKTPHFRMSSRAKEGILNNTPLHLGKFMAILGEHFQGSGGGHAGAAGCYGHVEDESEKKDPEIWMKEITKEILTQLREIVT